MNLDKIYDMIVASPVPDWDKELLVGCVEKAVETWVHVDASKKVLAVEEFGEEPFRYRSDLILENSGQTTIVDWKLRRGKLDERWESRLRKSWQGKIYAAGVQSRYGDILPVNVEIRGITLDEKPHTKTLTWVVDLAGATDAVQYIRGIDAMRQALVAREKTPWPRNPSGCEAFGPMYPCEWMSTCWEGKAEVGTGEPVKAFSHSSAEDFMRCPERYRLNQLTAREDKDDDVAATGRVFHELMAAIYTQIKEEYGS